MNHIEHQRIVIEFDVWEPQTKALREEVDALLQALKTKKLLAHAGNVKTVVIDSTQDVG